MRNDFQCSCGALRGTYHAMSCYDDRRDRAGRFDPGVEKPNSDWANCGPDVKACLGDRQQPAVSGETPERRP